MTYNVFGGMLSLTQSTNQFYQCCVLFTTTLSGKVGLELEISTELLIYYSSV